LENVEALAPNYSHNALKAQDSITEIISDVSEDRLLLLTMSAHDKSTLANNIRAHTAVVDHYNLHDFVYTLNNKRSVLSTKGFIITTEQTAAKDMNIENFKFTSSSTPVDKVAFIFTGQGAAWLTIGREAIKHFPLFHSVIQKLDLILRDLQHPPNFSIEQQLSCCKEEGQLHDSNVAQATLTAIQIATVDLLASWGIVPEATIGHSAGEIAASYAAGLGSAPAATIASYYRGYCLQSFGPPGDSILAVGKGVDDLKLSKLGPYLSVACENSPNSVTLSGPAAEIEEARETFTAQQVFAREVRTGMGYHSKYMKNVADPMANYIDSAVVALDILDYQWLQDPKPMLSTVTNKILNSRDVDGRYWAMNLTSPVKFNTAVSLLASSGSLKDVRGFVEVGPHSALSGPFKQIC
jgi:acyl transferase domain-containing protein